MALDNLIDISTDAIDEAVRASCCLVCFLDDETYHSEWVLRELKTAANANIEILVVVDIDRFRLRDLVPRYQELGLGYIFKVRRLQALNHCYK